MANSVNKVTLVGNLGHAPSIKSTQDGSRMATFSVATTRSVKNQTSGQWDNYTTWHKVVVFAQPLVNLAESYLKKGSRVYITGSLDNRTFKGRDGLEKTATEIVLRPFDGEIVLCDRAERDQGPTGDDYGSTGDAPPDPEDY